MGFGESGYGNGNSMGLNPWRVDSGESILSGSGEIAGWKNNVDSSYHGRGFCGLNLFFPQDQRETAGGDENGGEDMKVWTESLCAQAEVANVGE
jgi:hypothetical protein